MIGTSSFTSSMLQAAEQTVQLWKVLEVVVVVVVVVVVPPFQVKIQTGGS